MRPTDQSPSQTGGRERGQIRPRPCSVAGSLPAGASGDTRRHGQYLAESWVGAARALPRGLRTLSLRAAREGGARPGPGLPRALRRGHRHQLFARLLFQVRARVKPWGTRCS